MITVRFTLRPETAFGTPLVGETLFGQMCWAFVRLFGEERLNDLLKGYEDGLPFAVISDAFPHGCVPLPHLPSYLWQDAEGTDRKYLKTKRWLPISALKDAPYTWQRNSLSDGEAYPDGLRVAKTVSHNTINRMTMTTGVGQFAPYVKNQIWYNSRVSLDLYVVIDDGRTTIDEVKTALRYVGLTGYGRDAGVGLGKFTLVDTVDVCAQEPNTRTRLTLSSCALSGVEGLDADKTFYRVKTHFGRHGDQMARVGNPFKRPVLAAQTGALLTYMTAHDEPFVGRGIGGISSSQPSAVHQGYSPVLALTACF